MVYHCMVYHMGWSLYPVSKQLHASDEAGGKRNRTIININAQPKVRIIIARRRRGT